MTSKLDISIGAAMRSVGMGLFAGALFVFTAMAVESRIIQDLSGRK